MIQHIHVDIETYCDLSLKDVGMYRYALHPSFEILLVGMSDGGSSPRILDAEDMKSPEIRRELAEILQSGKYRKHAWNAAFEWFCLNQWLRANGYAESPLDQWEDTMLHAQYTGFPASLDRAGAAVGLPPAERKLSTGKALIRTFCTPRKPTARDPRTRVTPADEPGKWALFREYNAQDVMTEAAIDRLLSVYPVPDEVLRQWRDDVTSNAHGVAVDGDLVDGAIKIIRENEEALMRESAEITGLQNPNSRDQLLAWMQARTDKPIQDLTKETVANLLPGVNGDLKRILDIRLETGKAAPKKYEAIRRMTCSDGRLRGLMRFYGAGRTGRWSSVGVQLQNLKQTHISNIDLARQLVKDGNPDALRFCYGNVADALGQLVRTALIPTKGNLFVDADFSAIEARVIAWLAGEQWVLDVFRTHGKIYEATASQMFGVPMEKIVKGNPEYELRQRGKVATLACGYQGGTGAMAAMDINHAIDPDMYPELVRKWREANPHIVKYWYDTENAAQRALETGIPQKCGKCAYRYERYTVDGITLSHLICTLPSGRELFYANPRFGTNRFGERALQFDGVTGGNQWGAIDTYGGRLVENQCQAVARDVLADKLTELREAGYTPVFSVHDEVVLDVPLEKANLHTVTEIMKRPLAWAPGLPLNADGWTGEYFRKD